MTKQQKEQQQEQETLKTETFLTCKETAKLFRVTPKTISNWIKAGRFQSVVKRGRYKLIAASEIEMLLNETAGGAWAYEVTENGVKLCLTNTKSNSF